MAGGKVDAAVARLGVTLLPIPGRVGTLAADAATGAALLTGSLRMRAGTSSRGASSATSSSI
jgi:hypothetical protein